jgi:hypothetical protein
LAVAQAEQANHILSGDEQVLRQAARLGIVGLRASDVVVILKRAGLITSAKAVDQMSRQGFGVRERTYRDAVLAAGE